MYETRTEYTVIHEEEPYWFSEWDWWSWLAGILMVALLVFAVTSCISRPTAVAVTQPVAVAAPAVVHHAPLVTPLVVPAPVIVPHFGFGYHHPVMRSSVVRRTTITRTYSGVRRGR